MTNAFSLNRSPGPAETVGPGEQWLTARLCARPDLKFDVRHNASESHVVIEDPVRSKFFQIGFEEYQLIAALDGKKSLGQLVALNSESATADERMLKEARAIKIGQWLVQNNLVFGQGTDNSKRLEVQAKAVQRAKLMGFLNPISCKFKLFNPNRLLTALQPYTQWLFSGWMFAIWLLTGAYAGSVVFSHWDKFGHASAGIFSSESWFWLLLIWLALKVLHEAGHGIACRRFGGEVPEAGVLLLLFTPMAFVNVTSMWRFGNRWHRVIVSVAGMYVELFVSFISIIVWQSFPGVVGDIAFKVFVMASVTTLLFNANPLMRFDGYFILSDLLGVPNLYTKSTKWFGDRLKSLFFGIPLTPNICSAAELPFVAIYGSMAFFWKILISFSLIIGASVLFYGAGIVLGAMGVVLWFGIPIVGQVRGLFGEKAAHPINRRRLIISCVVTGLIAGSMFSILKAPASKSAPAIVQFADEIMVRAKADGFIREILVDNGQAVRKNQQLMVFENTQLSLQLQELERLANEAKMEIRIHINSGDLAASQAATEKQQGLLTQIGEQQEQVDGLTVRAPIDGILYQRNLENKLGSFAKQGDVLFSIANAKTKEVVVSIDQRDLESIAGNEGRSLRVAMPGMHVFESKLLHINASASTEPSHPALAPTLADHCR